MATKNTCDISDLSDGELLSSLEDMDQQEIGSNEDIAKTHSGKEEDGMVDSGEDDNGEWTLVTKGPPPRKRKNSSGDGGERKRKKKKMIVKIKKSKVADSVPTVTYLNDDQKSLLRILCQLVSVTSNEYGGPSTTIKTVDLQAVVRHIVLGDPAVGKKSRLTRALTLRNKRVVMVWLSCVSKDDFHASSDNFKGLKAIGSTVGFSIKHPGSDKFAKMGLDAFFEMDNFSVKLPPPVKINNFTKFHCVMSLDDLLIHKYPIPDKEKPDKPLPDGFIQLTAWPDEVKEEIASFPIFAIDCEMVETNDGKSSLARISVINEDMNCIYNTLVKPTLPITDYRTKFSGITEDMLKNVEQTLVDIQRELKELLPEKCILVGHSLECDFEVLKLCHPYVIDTSILFTPTSNPCGKPGLKFVTKRMLNLDIQTGNSGHDPTEDAIACMKLVKKKLNGGSKLRLKWKDGKDSIFNLLSQNSIPISLIDKRSVVRLYGRGMSSGCVTVSSDTQAVEEAKEQILDSQFTFVQLHGLENYRTGDPEDQSADALKQELNALDEHVCELIGSCCQETLVLVVCGSGYIGKVRKIQTAPVPDDSALIREVDITRTGYVIALLK